jgi:hypothetical protein
MADPILRVDLSAAAPDFQPVALEAGVPLLDRAGTNYAVLRRWLGEFAAEPTWEANQTVGFHIHQADRGRMSSVECLPATKQDLEGALGKSVEQFVARAKKIKPASPAEESLQRLVAERVAIVETRPAGQDDDCQFFKCRQGKGPWQLVWCWGYQRKDTQPATASICSQSGCANLFLARAPKARCPRCSAAARRAGDPKGGLLKKRVPLVAALLLLLLGAGAVFLAMQPPELRVDPQAWKGPQGSHVAFSFHERRWLFWDQELSKDVVAKPEKSGVVEFAPGKNLADAVKPGKTEVTFTWQGHQAVAQVEVSKPGTPQSLEIDPKQFSLPVGAHQPVKVLGIYADGRRVDLSEDAKLESSDSEIAKADRGHVAGLAPGKATLKVSYGDTADAPPAVASADIKVLEPVFKKLTAKLEPAKFGIGRNSQVKVLAVDAAGQEHDVTGSSALQLSLEPGSVARLDGGRLIGSAAGKGKLQASYAGLKESLPFTVTEADKLADGALEVKPQEVELAVNEQSKLEIAAADADPITVTSSDPKVVKTQDDGTLVGLEAGTADVTVHQGKQDQVVHVKVNDAPLQGLQIEPLLTAVHVGETLPVRVVATTKDKKQIQLAPAGLVWSTVPAAEHAKFDPATLKLTGVAPTTKPEKLAVELGSKLHAETDVEILTAHLPPSDAHQPPSELLAGGAHGRPVTTGKLTTEVTGTSEAHKTIDGKLNGTLAKDHTATAIGGHPGVVGGPSVIGSGVVGPGIVGGPGVIGSGVVGPGAVNHPGVAIDPTILGGPRVVGQTGAVTGPGVVTGPGYIHRHGGVYVAPGVVGGSSSTVVGPAAGRDVVVTDVKLLDVQLLSVSSKQLQPQFNIQVSEPGQYRLVDASAQPLSDWTQLPGQSTATLVAQPIPRKQDDEYDVYVERKIGDAVKHFGLSFRVKADK